MKIYICRHGETEWSANGRHTGTTDLSLTDEGVDQAKRLGGRLEGFKFAKVLCSPMQRACQTASLAGLEEQIEVCDDIVEWNYGKYEGLTTPEIHQTVPDWLVFTHGGLEGESPEQVSSRADRAIEQILGCDGDVAIFSHGHFSRVLAVRWLEMAVAEGARFDLGTATLSILGYVRNSRGILLWNQRP